MQAASQDLSHNPRPMRKTYNVAAKAALSNPITARSTVLVTDLISPFAKSDGWGHTKFAFCHQDDGRYDYTNRNEE
jgi:hypothetical protein